MVGWVLNVAFGKLKPKLFYSENFFTVIAITYVTVSVKTLHVSMQILAYFAKFEIL